MGEVGETLFGLLDARDFDCVGIDIESSKYKNYSEKDVIENPEYLHVCLPGELTDFVDITLSWILKLRDLKAVIVHSTVRQVLLKIFKKDLVFQFYFHRFVAFTEDSWTTLKDIQNLLLQMIARLILKLNQI